MRINKPRTQELSLLELCDLRSFQALLEENGGHRRGRDVGDQPIDSATQKRTIKSQRVKDEREGR